MSSTFPSYLEALRAALSGWPGWVQTAVAAVSIVVTLAPAALREVR